MGFVIAHAEKFKKKDSCCLFLVVFISHKIMVASLQRTLPFTMHSCNDPMKRYHLTKLLRHLKCIQSEVDFLGN